MQNGMACTPKTAGQETDFILPGTRCFYFGLMDTAPNVVTGECRRLVPTLQERVL